MSMMSKTLHVMLLASSAIAAATLQGSPKMLSILEEKVKSWSGDAQNVPDGKMFMLRKDPNDDSAGFIINTTPNNLISSSSSSILDISTPYNDPKTEYTNSDSHANFLLVDPTDVPIAPASETGLRGNGTLYDAQDVWIFNAYRLSETSQPDADPNSLIGFEHNEDYWADTGTKLSCTYKSIGVRYSKDLGKSWTRSVPIITKDKQNATCQTAYPFTGTGDFSTVWSPDKKEWITLAQEGPLVMSRSSDALARPGTWTRLDPVSGKTAPGFIGDGTTLAHPDLVSLGGANPSIIRDQKNAVWHMVYSIWGNGIAYTKSTDLYRWDTPITFWKDDSTPNSKYPTLVGDAGDTLTTDGTATMLFGADNTVAWGRALWSVQVDFGGSGSTNSTTTPSNLTQAGSLSGSSGSTPTGSSSASSNSTQVSSANGTSSDQSSAASGSSDSNGASSQEASSSSTKRGPWRANQTQTPSSQSTDSAEEQDDCDAD